MRQKCYDGCECRRHLVRSAEYREKIRQALTGRSLSVECKEKISQALMGRSGARRSAEARLSMRENKLRFYEDEGNRQAQSEQIRALCVSGVQMGHRGPWTEEQKERIRQGVRRAWFEGRRRGTGYAQPNKVEVLLGELIADLGFQFVGDGKLIINGRCPDFWNGDHRVVELFGDYWHRGEDPRGRQLHFARAGYRCLVIWENEVKTAPEQVRARVERWMS